MKTAPIRMPLAPKRALRAVVALLAGVAFAEAPAGAASTDAEARLLGLLDAPLLFVKRHSYTGIHIYDTFYKWPPGGGIYVLENPSAPRAQWRIRPVIDPTTPGTLGVGVYSHPELSWDARKLLFCFKGSPGGSTSIYEIGLDGRGLRRLTDPTPTCANYKGAHSGQHDIAPAYLPDGRIVFLSTRPSGLVPCANEGVSILHVTNADGSDIHPISVNNVNEFDPSVLPDGRILFGRWEYVDKTALTQQSLWTINPDGTGETAFFANNMVFPEAILDARPVPGSHLVVGTFTPHNAPPRGAIAFVDPRLGKNDPAAITNLEHPTRPTHDRGDSCEPWPLSAEVVLFSGRPPGHTRNVIEMMDRAGHRLVVLADSNICLHSPMLVKPRPVPAVLADTVDRSATTGRFFVQDIYQGLTGVKRGDVKWLRVIEETSRVSPTHPGSNPYNQTFLVSAALAFSVKNYLGLVPVEPDGSVHFEAPAGRALYFQALDAERRLVQSMRTFIQAAPGTTRSCIGCHEHKYTTATAAAEVPRHALSRPPRPLEPERWGSGFMDFPSMVQPVLDRHCVHCHGGRDGLGGGMDLNGGWTEHFSISYENLVSRRETQLRAYWIAGIDCMNGTAHGSAPILPPRRHGSGAAPLAELIARGHGGRLPRLTPAERDLIMAWIDSNGLYHGTWDYTKHGCAVTAWPAVKQALIREMQTSGCARCHDAKGADFQNDWFNLKEPELSRILRAPLAPGADGFGLGLCRDRSVDPKRPRVRLLWNGYAHAVLPLESYAPQPWTPPDTNGAPVVSFSGPNDPRYQAMLAIIRRGREQALAAPRVDMPGAEITAGACRRFVPPAVPEVAPALTAVVGEDGVVELSWERSARTIGLEADVHRAPENDFAPGEKTLLVHTALFRFTDAQPPEGRQHYALVLRSGGQRSRPSYVAVSVPRPPPPPAPGRLMATAAPGSVRLRWEAPAGRALAYHVYRARSRKGPFSRLTAEPLGATAFADGTAEPSTEFTYVVRAVRARGVEGEASGPATAAALPAREPVFAAVFAENIQGTLGDGTAVAGQAHGPARCAAGALDLQRGGHVTFAHREEFDLEQPFTLECWARLEPVGQMPVLVSCGAWQQAGWFLQRLGGLWRWHVAGLDCDGGQAVANRWVHLIGTFDGHTARLYQDGVPVAEKTGAVRAAPWPGELHVGQYSAGPGAPYQVIGQMAGLKLYHRALSAAEAARAAQSRPPGLQAAAR